MLAIFQQWWCTTFHPRYWDIQIFRGTLEHGVKFVHCLRCNSRYVLNDARRVFLRYDHDEEFIRGLCFIYQIERYLLFQ
jgi:hypothetical protein